MLCAFIVGLEILKDTLDGVVILAFDPPEPTNEVGNDSNTKSRFVIYIEGGCGWSLNISTEAKITESSFNAAHPLSKLFT